MGVVGSLTIIIFSIYQFEKLKHLGFSTKESLIRTGKSAMLSEMVLILAITAQGIWGGPAGIIVSISAGVIRTGYVIIRVIEDKNIAQRVVLYVISESRKNAEQKLKEAG